RHPREYPPHARHRHAGLRPPGGDLQHFGRHGRYRRRPVCPVQCLRHPRRPQFLTLRRHSDHSDSRRHRPTLRRLYRRRRLHAAGRRTGQDQPGPVGVRGRPGAGSGGDVLPQRDPGRGRTPGPRRRDRQAMTALLEIAGLQKHFGALQVTRDVSLSLERGARHALIGPNGAGKTTLINLVTGFLRPSSGRILLAGRDITDLGQAERVKRGIARTFQINQLFLGLSVLDNVALAVAERTGSAWSLLRGARASATVADEALNYLDRLSLTADARVPVRELSYGRQRLVEIAIALALEPQVLLLDEPAAGVPSTESHIILDAVASLPAEMAILIIEHDMDVVFQFARRISVLVGGAVLVEGPPDAIAADPQVREVYLGKGNHG